MKRVFGFLGFGKAARWQEIDAEIEAHLASRAGDLEREGFTPAEAREEALRRFGDLAAARRRLYRSARNRDRRVRSFHVTDALAKDVSLAWTRARKTPGHTALTLTVFALGVGLATTTFGLVDQVLLRPLPFPEPERLVRLESMGESRQPFPLVSATNWWDWRQAASIEASAIYTAQEMTVQVADRAVSVAGAAVGGAFFETLNPRTVAGRPLTEQDLESGAPLAVVSASFWRSALGAPTDLETLTLRVNGTPTRVLGVVASDAAFPVGTDLWVRAFYQVGSGGMRNNINYRSIARLRVGATVEQARAELQSIADGIREAEPVGIYSYGVGVRPLREAVVESVDDELRLLLWAAALVLVVGCANLAGLSLARGAVRRREIAVRTALGAGRGRLVRQLLTEQLALGVAGGTIGIFLAAWTTGFLRGALVALIPRADQLQVDWRIALAGVALSLAAGAASGIIPALRMSNVAPAAHLAGSGSTARGAASLPSATLVAVELALAVALLSGSGLLVRSFASVVDRDLGFEPRGVVVAPLRLTGADYSDVDRLEDYWTRAIDALESIPGVVAGVVSVAPGGGFSGSTFLSVEGIGRADVGAQYSVVSDRYFDVAGIDLLEGAVFDDRVGRETERVAIIDRAFAEHFWPGQSAVGRRVRADSFESWMYGGTAPWLRVVGVVESVRQGGYEGTSRSQLYVHYRQVPRRAGAMTVVARGTNELGPETVRRTLEDLDRSIAVEVDLMERGVADALRGRWLLMAVLVAFAFLTLSLASLGIYGLMAHAVSSRRREIALRKALGAREHTIQRLVFGQALKLVAVGTLGGLVVSFWTSAVLESFLVEVNRWDPATGVGVAALMFAVSCLATLIPAVRATRASPAGVLRAPGEG